MRTSKKLQHSKAFYKKILVRPSFQPFTHTGYKLVESIGVRLALHYPTYVGFMDVFYPLKTLQKK